MNRSLIRNVLAAAVAAAVVFSATASHAAHVAVDGNVADLMDAVSAFPDQSASGTESGFDAEGNGFDITNYYASYSIADDVFYFGFQTQGPVGQSCNPTSNGLCFLGESVNFESRESVGFQLDLGSISFVTPDVEIILTGDDGAGVGPDNVSSLIEPVGITVSWAVSEADNGIEFGVSGLAAAGLIPNFSLSNPFDYTARFSGGGSINSLTEDEALLSAQLVPVPAAVWLFGSGLAGLIGFARRRS